MFDYLFIIIIRLLFINSLSSERYIIMSNLFSYALYSTHLYTYFDVVYVYFVERPNFKGGPVFSRHRGNAGKLSHQVYQSEIGSWRCRFWIGAPLFIQNTL